MPGATGPVHAVDRPDLRRRLDSSLDRTLSLIVAPAGSGKSVLLSQWLGTHPEVASVWVALDPTDDDPVRFARKLLAGLAPVNPEVVDLGPLVAVAGGGLGRGFLKALGAQLCEFPEVVVVFDDLHRLTNVALLGDVAELVELFPPNAHMIVSTRTDVGIAWGRHRMQLDVLELRQSDLAFDETDAAELLERISRKHLSSDGVAALVHRTEGWAAGLQLAAILLQLEEDPNTAIAQFSGHDRIVADYLSGEVLDAQSEHVRRFLLRASVFDEFSAELMAELTRVVGAQDLIDELERKSMFVVQLDPSREWFRFHHLFRELLRWRLRGEDPTAEPTLLRTAARWHLHRGDVGTAVEYLLRARDWEAALDVVLSQGQEVFERGEMATVIRWIEAVPVSVRADRNDVALLLGTVQMGEGQSAHARDTLHRVADAPTATAGQRAAALGMLAGLVQWHFEPEYSSQMAQRSLAALDTTEPSEIPNVLNLTDWSSLETVSMGSYGRALFLTGDFAAARRWLEEALTTQGAWYSIWRVSVLGSLGLLEAWCGNLARADALAHEALALAQETGRIGHPSTADAYLAHALVALEQGRPEGASLSLHEARLRARSNRRTTLMWIGELQRAQLHLALGQPDQVLLTLKAAEGSIGTPQPPIVAERALALCARSLRLQGRPAAARRLLAEMMPERPAVAFERAAAALSLGDTAGGAKLAAPLLGSSREEPVSTLLSLLMAAWIASDEGADGEAGTTLRGAMELAERCGLVERVVDAGPTVVALIARFFGRSPLAVSIATRSAKVRGAPRGETLIDPLTTRELELLSHLPTRMSNAELAATCFVSVNTVKTHVAHIYRKLGVTNRDEAVERAGQLGLL